MHDDEIPNKIFRNNWQTHHLQGRVKLITEIIKRHYESDKDYALKEFITFDTLGNHMETSTYIEQDQDQLLFKDRYTYKYDNKGNYIEKAWFEENGSLRIKIIFRFDEQDKVIEIAKYDHNNALTDKTGYIYDIPGNVVGYSSVFPQSSYKYTYDAPGRCTSQECYSNDSTNCSRKSVFEYTDDTIEETTFGKEGLLQWKVLSRYNNNEQLIRRTHYSASGNTDFEDSWQYDDFGNLIAYIKKKAKS
jgi:hypothetical protein